MGLEGRLAEQDALDAAVEAWTVRHDAFELTQQLQTARVAAYPVMGPPDLAADPNYDALRKTGVRIGPDADLSIDQLYHGVPWKLTRTPGVISRPSPLKGGHNEYVFRELLGLSAEQLAALQERRVV